MGVERAVTRWYLQRQVILDEIAALEARLAQLQERGQELADNAAIQPNAGIAQQLEQAREKLRALGPCPQPKMG